MAKRLGLRSEHRAREPAGGKFASSPTSPKPGSPAVLDPSTPFHSHPSVPGSPRQQVSSAFSPFSTPQSPTWLLRTSDLSYPTSPQPTQSTIFRLRRSDSGANSPRILLIPEKPERRNCLADLETAKREVRETGEELVHMKERVRELEGKLRDVEHERDELKKRLEREKKEVKETLEMEIDRLSAALNQHSCCFSPSPPPSDELFQYVLDENAALKAQLQTSQRTLHTQLPGLLSSLYEELASIRSDLMAMEQFLKGLKRGNRGLLQGGPQRERKKGPGGWSKLCMQETTGIKETIRSMQTAIADLYALHSADICSPQ